MIQKSTSLEYEPSLELLRITAEQLSSNRELYGSVQLSVEEFSTYTLEYEDNFHLQPEARGDALYTPSSQNPKENRFLKSKTPKKTLKPES